MPQQPPFVVLRTLSHGLLSTESIDGIFLNLLCLKIALLLQLTSIQWARDSGALLVCRLALGTKVEPVVCKACLCGLYELYFSSLNSLALELFRHLGLFSQMR